MSTLDWLATHPSITFSTADAAGAEADFLVVPVLEDDDRPDLASVDALSGGELGRARGRREFRGKPYEMLAASTSGAAAPRVLYVGAGKGAAFDTERLRRVATAGALAARQRGGGRVAIVLRAADGRETAAAAQAAAEGLVLAALDTDVRRTQPRDAAALTSGAVVAPGGSPALAAVVDRGRTLGVACNIARWMSNEPGNALTPLGLAEVARALLAGTSVAVDVLERPRLEELGMGLLLGVGQGSANPPCLIAMRYTPPGGRTTPVLGLVGKGVTFDTGGISIKPSESMEKMKHDMTGGASVVAAMWAVAALAPPIPVLGLVPAAENMPGGRAIRPGDILTSASGKTVEVNNTDAEGRLILADALWYARQQGATHLVDIATLTGAIVVALGTQYSGLFAWPDAWGAVVRAAAARAGDRVWPMPVHEDFLELLKSDYADLVNTGGRPAGAISAAMFLKEFTGEAPWAHLDIAGTAWADEAKPWQPKGATGVSVRTLVELAFTSAEW
jgi:leucyl aminopeptidase